MRTNFIHDPLPKVSLERVEVNGKRFYATPEGLRLPSITTVLSHLNAKHIFEWRNRVGKEEADKISKRASSGGTALHQLCEDYVDNKPLDFKTPDIAMRFKDFIPVLNRIDNVRCQEHFMFSSFLRMAGATDLIADFDGKRSVIDYKTSSKPKQKEWIENYFMQTAGYAVMCEELYGIAVPQIVILISVEHEPEPQIFVEKRNTWVPRLLEARDTFEQLQRG